MHLPATVQQDLQALTDALDDPDADLSGSFTRLAASVRLTVQSYLGLSLLVASGPDDTVLTVFDDVADRSLARTSLFLALSATEGSTDEPTLTGLVLYAGTPGAFVDLAADAAWLDVAHALSLDHHLPAPTDTTPSTFLGDRSTINEALGVLLSDGTTLQHARAELHHRAQDGRVSDVSAARRILAELDERSAWGPVAGGGGGVG